MADNSQPLILAPDPAGIAYAAKLLRGGGVVAVPTETVYGLAARADSDYAVAAIYRAKDRPNFNPLIVHIPDLQRAEQLADIDERGAMLAEAFWPGALTLVVPKRSGSGIAAAVSAGLPTIALRCPAHPVMRELLVQSGLSLAAPSANRSGAVSPTSPAHVAASLGKGVDAILDGGACETGIESTIIALREDGAWEVLRPGPVTAARIAGVLGREATLTRQTGIESPGQLASHYAPGKPVRLNAVDARADEFHIGFGGVAGDTCLAEDGDLAIAAARLYDALHRAAASPQQRIAVAPVPDQGIGAAINDRLRRAAA